MEFQSNQSVFECLKGILLKAGFLGSLGKDAGEFSVTLMP
jgi:hypothetical protein